MIYNDKKTIFYKNSIREAVKKMDIEKLNSLIVVKDNKKAIGFFTLGDFRRAVFFWFRRG